MKYIYLTVDVECHKIEEENLYIYGKIGEEYYGIDGIMDVADKYGVPVNFFINIVECHKYGEEYVRRIVEHISKRGHPIHLHLHPSCVMQDGRPFFWHYSENEQMHIINQGNEDFEKFVGNECIAFRAGSYSSNERMYHSLSKVFKNRRIVDLSYCYGYEKQCHYYAPFYNKPHLVDNVIVLPNTRYCSFKLFKKRKYTNLDIVSSRFNEMKRIIDSNNLNCLVCTMHSWSLLKFWFYKGKTMKKSKTTIRKMEKFIVYAQSKNYVFSAIDNNIDLNSSDDDLDLCKSPLNVMKGWINMFIRLQNVARTNKKYLLLFSLFYSMVGLIILSIILLILFK